MKLAEFKADRGLGLTELSALLGLKPSTVHGYLTAFRRPSLGRAVLISRATGNAVTVADLLPLEAQAFGAPTDQVAA